jgi:hypothetical protein
VKILLRGELAMTRGRNGRVGKHVRDEDEHSVEKGKRRMRRKTERLRQRWLSMWCKRSGW